MAKGAYLHRYLLIMNFLSKKNYTTMEEILDLVKNNFDYLKEVNELLKMGISKRTIERDFKEIRSLYEVNIEYCRKNKGYFIENKDSRHWEFLNFLENYEILNTIKNNHENLPYVILENRRALGLENFNFILEAIKKGKMVRFTHKKNWDEHTTIREVMPLALKEFKNRWYLISYENNKIRTFGIDRISDIAMTNKDFSKPEHIDVASLFDDSFGIIYEAGKPQRVLLSFTNFQAKYIESLPLHKSQNLESKDEETSIYSYNLHITFDFEQELLGLGNRVLVLEPKKLAAKIAEEHRSAWELYQV